MEKFGAGHATHPSIFSVLSSSVGGYQFHCVCSEDMTDFHEVQKISIPIKMGWPHDVVEFFSWIFRRDVLKILF
jgi:hypothetical protein